MSRVRTSRSLLACSAKTPRALSSSGGIRNGGDLPQERQLPRVLGDIRSRTPLLAVVNEVGAKQFDVSALPYDCLFVEICSEPEGKVNNSIFGAIKNAFCTIHHFRHSQVPGRTSRPVL